MPGTKAPAPLKTASGRPASALKSAFSADMHRIAYPIEYQLTLCVSRIAGGIPSDKNVTESWIRTKLGDRAEDVIQAAVAEAIVERGLPELDPDAPPADDAGEADPAENGKAKAAAAKVDRDAIIREVALRKHLNGFKRVNGPGTQLMIEGRNLKAAIKEAASAAVAVDKVAGRGWGTTRKGLQGFLAEHVFIKDLDLPLWKPTIIEDGDVDDDGNRIDAYDFDTLIPVMEPDGINQRFVHTWRGSGISLEEFVDYAVVRAHVLVDHPFTLKDWAMILLTGEKQGIGASRSQGYGTYTVVGWDLVRDSRPKAAREKNPVVTE